MHKDTSVLGETHTSRGIGGRLMDSVQFNGRAWFTQRQ
jgi:hypothetical protein